MNVKDILDVFETTWASINESKNTAKKIAETYKFYIKSFEKQKEYLEDAVKSLGFLSTLLKGNEKEIKTLLEETTNKKVKLNDKIEDLKGNLKSINFYLKDRNYSSVLIFENKLKEILKR